MKEEYKKSPEYREKARQEMEAINRKQDEERRVYWTRFYKTEVVKGMNLPWGFVLLHYSWHSVAQLPGGYLDQGMWAFMDMFEPVSPGTEAFKQARWLVVDFPQISKGRVWEQKQVSTPGCMKAPDDLQRAAEPLLGYDDYFWDEGSVGRHNVLLHRGSFQTACLLSKL